MVEDALVEEVRQEAEHRLRHPLLVARGECLLYQVRVDNRLKVTVRPKQPRRGHSAFQTDLAVFERIDKTTRIPRVVMEFKTKVTTHDLLTYNAKATLHKQIYPYLRYGMVAAREAKVSGKVFVHGGALDFFVAAAAFTKTPSVHEILADLLEKEVATSRLLEGIAFEKKTAPLFRREFVLGLA
jgi:hypothetical protein